MQDYSKYFIDKIDDNNAISFLIGGKKRDESFYNYLVRKITSQLEVRENIYPIGPTLLIPNTKRIISPIWEDKDPFILEIINKYDNIFELSDEYIEKLEYNEDIIDEKIFKDKINKYFDAKKLENINKYYKYFKKWIEIMSLLPKKAEYDEKKDYLKNYTMFFYSIENVDNYIDNLKIDIVSNYNMYKAIFLNDFKDKNFYETIDFIRNNMINKMLVKCDNRYRSYDLNTLRNNSFFEKTTKPEFIDEEIENLNKEYEKLKGIVDFDEYIDNAILIFQNYLRIHPYRDGNGRSSRLLLDIMLLNRNILPPILYNSNYDRPELDAVSNEYTIRGNIDPIAKFIKSKIKETNQEFNNLIKGNNLNTI